MQKNLNSLRIWIKHQCKVCKANRKLADINCPINFNFFDFDRIR